MLSGFTKGNFGDIFRKMTLISLGFFWLPSPYLFIFSVGLPFYLFDYSACLVTVYFFCLYPSAYLPVLRLPTCLFLQCCGSASFWYRSGSGPDFPFWCRSTFGSYPKFYFSSQQCQFTTFFFSHQRQMCHDFWTAYWNFHEKSKNIHVLS